MWGLTVGPDTLPKDESGTSLLPGEDAPRAYPGISMLRGSIDAGPKALAQGALCITNFRVYFREVRISFAPEIFRDDLTEGRSDLWSSICLVCRRELGAQVQEARH